MAGASDHNARDGAELWLNFVALVTRTFKVELKVTRTFIRVRWKLLATNDGQKPDKGSRHL